MLFPYNIQRENLASCQRWTQESTVSAGDVHGMIGSPPVFRLRYLFIIFFLVGFLVIFECKTCNAHDLTSILSFRLKSICEDLLYVCL